MKMARENKIISVDEATNSLKREKAIFVITDMNDYVNIMGYICYISKNEDTYDELINKYHKLGKEGKQVMLIGSYESGGCYGCSVYP